MSMTTTALEVRLREAEQRAQEAENLISAAAVLHEAGIPPESPEAHSLFHELVQLPDEQAMRQALREATSAPTDGKDYTPEARELLAKKGLALPDGSFPIKDEGDLKNAIRAIGRAKDPAAAKAHIIKRAKALGATNCCQKTGRARHGNLILRSRSSSRRSASPRSTVGPGACARP